MINQTGSGDRHGSISWVTRRSYALPSFPSRGSFPTLPDEAAEPIVRCSRRGNYVLPSSAWVRNACPSPCRLIRTTDPIGAITTQIFDANSRLIATIDPLGLRNSYAYDGSSNLIPDHESIGSNQHQRVRPGQPCEGPDRRVPGTPIPGFGVPGTPYLGSGDTVPNSGGAQSISAYGVSGTPMMRLPSFVGGARGSGFRGTPYGFRGHRT